MTQHSLHDAAPTTLRVTYMEIREAPVPTPARAGRERIARERMTRATYLDLYGRVGGPVRWDRRLLMPATELEALLACECLDIYVLRDEQGHAVGFCEFDRREFPDIELKHFGLITDAQGRGLGSWLLSTALVAEWKYGPSRIWLHTDTWDHPAAVRVYELAGFYVFAVRDEAVASL